MSGQPGVREPVVFAAVGADDREAVADWLASDTWPFHVGVRPTREEALARFDGGDFTGPGRRAWWVLAGDERAGFVFASEIEEGESPSIDLRLKSAYRGRGLGHAALRFMTGAIFAGFPFVRRIEGNTREDNHAMRATFRKVGYVKEAYYRASWPTAEGGWVAGTCYAMLRDDWERGTRTPVVWDGD